MIYENNPKSLSFGKIAHFKNKAFLYPLTLTIDRKDNFTLYLFSVSIDKITSIVVVIDLLPTSITTVTSITVSFVFKPEIKINNFFYYLKL